MTTSASQISGTSSEVMTFSQRLSRAVCFALTGVLISVTGCADLSKPEEIGIPKQFHQRQLVLTLVDDRLEHRAAITQSLIDDFGLTAKGQFPLQSINVQCIVLQVPADWSVADEMERLAKDRRVEAVQINQFFSSHADGHDDPYAKMQYGARMLGATLAHRWSTGRGVKVAVIDTGIEINHPDLQGRIVQRENFVDGGEPMFMLDKHGTAIAGVISANADNGNGIVGVAPESELLAAKACWQDPADPSRASCSTWTLAKALDYAIAHNARIINMSLSGPYDPLLARLLTAAAARNIAIVAATAEPQASEPGFPASHPTVIPVISSNANNQVSLPRWHRDGVLAAPGEEILTTTPPNAYDFLSGSSLAAAHVSGAIALLLQLEPTLTPTQTFERLRDTAQPSDIANQGAGSTALHVNVCAALSKQISALRCN